MTKLDELDRLAGEKIMGYTFEPNEWQQRDDELRQAMGIEETWGKNMPKKIALFADGQRWQPTKNISQAWHLWEKLRESREFCCMDIRAPESEGWEVSVTKSVGEKHVQVVLIGGGDSKMSAAETITRACLRAKGVEV